MLIQIDGVTILELTTLDLSILADNIPVDILNDDIIRRLRWVLSEKLNTCGQDLIVNNAAIISKYQMVPSDKNALYQLIISDQDYQDRKTRDLQNQNKV